MYPAFQKMSDEGFKVTLLISGLFYGRARAPDPRMSMAHG